MSEYLSFTAHHMEKYCVDFHQQLYQTQFSQKWYKKQNVIAHVQCSSSSALNYYFTTTTSTILHFRIQINY